MEKAKKETMERKEREPVTRRKSAISYKTREKVVVRGYNLSELAEAGYTFEDGIFVLLQGRIPMENEMRMLRYEMAEFIEHSMSPSAAAAITTMGGRPLLPAAIAAAIMCFGAAHGPGAAHGYMCDEFFERAAKENKKDLKELAKTLVDEYLREKKPIQGLGQPQHIYGDPRVYPTFRRSQLLGTAGIYNQFQIEILNELNRRRMKGGKSLVHPNMIGAGNSSLMDLGFSPLGSFIIGSVSRGYSCAAHAIEQLKRGHAWMASRREKMVQLLDLSMLKYEGPPDREVPPLRDREKYAQEQKKKGEWKKWSL